MKNFLIKTALTILIGSFLTGCANDQAVFQELPELTNKTIDDNLAYHIYLEPNGDPLLLQKALNQAIELERQVIIKLLPGTYVIQPTEISNFKGSIVGSGPDKTILKSVTGLDCQYMANNDIWPTLLKFRFGDVTIKDLSFDIDQTPCELWTAWLGSEPEDKYLGAVVMVTGYTYSPDILGEKEHAKSYFENVWFKGIVDEDGKPSIDNCIMLGAEIPNTVDLVKNMDGGKHVIKNCKFETADAGIQVHYTDHTLVDMSNNFFRNILYYPGFFFDCSGSKFEFNYNTIKQTKRSAIYCNQYFLADLLEAGFQELSHFNIRNNHIEHAEYSPTIFVNDPRMSQTGEPSLKLILDNNHLNLNSVYTGFLGYGLKNAVVKNNHFNGSGTAAVAIDYGAKDGVYVNNDFSEFTAWYAHVYLGESTENNKIIGINEDNVVDFGTHNKIIGGKVTKDKLPKIPLPAAKKAQGTR